MKNKTASQKQISPGTRTLLFILSLILLAGLIIWGITGNFGLLLAKSTPLPINLHSASQANYAKDPEFMQIPPMNIQLVIDAIWDQNLNAQNLSVRLTQVNDSFLSAVSSITPKPTETNDIGSNESTQGAASSMTLTISPESPISTLDLTPSLTLTKTPPGFVASPTSTASNTILAPTNTSLAPTSTSSPPTNTTSPCSQLSLSSFSVDAKKAAWSLNNGSSTLVTLSQISISWPVGNSSLDKIFLGNSKIWDLTASPPSVVISSGWTGSSRDLNGNSSTQLLFTFLELTTGTGYNLTINFTNGCAISKSN